MLSSSRQKAKKFYVEVTCTTKTSSLLKPRPVYSANSKAVIIHFLKIIYESRYKAHDIIFLRYHTNRHTCTRATMRYIVRKKDCTAKKRQMRAPAFVRHLVPNFE